MSSCARDIDDWLNSAGNKPPLTPEEVNSISKKIQSLEENDPKRKRLVNKLVEHNLLLVVFCVKRFIYSSTNKDWNGPDTVDFLQVGTIGLMRAAEMFDPTRGFSFSTYALHWIRSKITRHNLKTLTPWTVPEDNFRRAHFYKKHGYLKNKRTGQNVDDEVAKKLVRDVSSTTRPVSFDQENEEGSDLHGVIADNRYDIEEVEFVNNFRDELQRCRITERQISILKDIYVRNDSTRIIAERHGITMEKVRAEHRVALRIARTNQALLQLEM